MSWFFTIFFLITLTFNNYSPSEASRETKHPSAVVVGTVYCDTCFQQDFSHSSHFISGASVGVECKDGDENSKPSFRTEVKTDSHGQFKINLPFSVAKHVKKIEGCSVKLISSSEPYCAVASSATSSSLHLKSRKQGTHIFSAGFFTFKPLKQPSLCNQKPSIQNSKEFNSQKFQFPPTEDLAFPSPAQDSTVPNVPPLPRLADLPPLPQLPPLPLPPVSGLPGLPTIPEVPNLPPLPTGSHSHASKQGQSLAGEKIAHPNTFFGLPPNPFQPPQIVPPIPNPLQPPPAPLVPNLPPIPGITPPAVPAPLLPNLPPIPGVPGLTPSPSPPPPFSLLPPLPPLIPFPPRPLIPGIPPASSSSSKKTATSP